MATVLDLKINADLDQLASHIRQLTQYADAISRVDRELTKLTSTLNNIGGSSGRAVANATQNIGDLARVFAALERVVSGADSVRASGRLSSMINPTDMDKLLKTITKLFKTLRSLPTIPAGTLAELGAFFTDFEGIIRGIQRASAAGMSIDDANIDKLSRVIKSITKAFKGVSDIRPDSLEGIITFFGVLATHGNQLRDGINSLGEIKFNVLGGTLGTQIGNALKVIKKTVAIFADIPPSSGEGIKGVASFFRIIAKESAGLQAGLEAFGNFNTRRLGGLMNSKELNNLTRVLKTFVKFFNDIGKLFEKTDIKAFAFQAIARVITSVSQMAELLGKREVDFSYAAKSAKGLKEFGNEIGNGLRALTKGLRKVTNLSDIAVTLSSLSDILRLIKNLGDDAVSFGGTSQFGKTMASFFKEIAVAVSELSRAKINPKEFKALSQLFKALGDVGKLPVISAQSIEGLGHLFRVLVEYGGKEIKRLDTDGLRKNVKDLVSISKDLNKINIDPAKVQAITELSKLSGMDIQGIKGSFGIEGPLQSITSAARTATSVIGDLFVTLGRTIKNSLEFMVSWRPFQSFVKNAQTAIKTVAQDFIGLGRELREIGRDMRDIGRDMMISGGITAFVNSAAVSLAADFESIMKQIEVLGDVTGTALEESRQFILDLGESSVFSASEVGAAFLDLSKSGLSVQEIFAALGPITDLAAAGMIGIGDASGIVINAVGAMSLEFTDATRIADAFVAAANVSTSEVADLATGFGYAGPVAKSFGQDLEVVVASLALLSDRGLDASKAGTGLRQMLTSMGAPTETASGYWLEMSERLTMFRDEWKATDSLLIDSEGNFRNLGDIMVLLGDALQGMTEAERFETLKGLFGTVQAATAAMNMLEDPDALNAYIAAMEEAAPAAAVGAALMDTFKGSIEELSGAMETLLIKSLTPVIDYMLRPMVDALTSIIRAVSKLPAPVLAAAAAFVGFGTVIMTLGGALLWIGGTVITALSAAFTTLGGALLALAHPFRAAMALQALELTLHGLLVTVGFVIPMFIALAGVLATIKEAIQTDRVQESFSRLSASIDRLKASISEVLEPLLMIVGAVFNAVFAGAVKGMAITIAALADAFAMMADSARESITPLRDMVDAIGAFFGLDLFPSASGGFMGSLNLQGGLDAINDAKDAIDDIRTVLDPSTMPEFTLGSWVDEFDKVAFAAMTFEEQFEFLRLNSMEWDFDIAALREWRETADLVANSTEELTYSWDYLGGSLSQAVEPVNTIADGLDRMAELENINFAELGAQLEGFASNPIIKMLFGSDITGERLAFGIGSAVFGLKLLRTELDSVRDSFRTFFDELKTGVPISEAFDNLTENLTGNLGRLAAIGLRTFANLTGFSAGGTLDTLIENLEAGALDKIGDVFIDLGARAIDYFLTGFARKIGKVAIFFTDIIDTLFGTNFGEGVRLIAHEFQRSVSIITSTLVKLVSVTNTALATLGFGKRKSKFGFIGEAIARLLILVGQAWKFFNDNILQVAANLLLARNEFEALAAILEAPFFNDLFHFIFGTDIQDIVRNLLTVVDIVERLGEALGDFVGGIGNLLAGKFKDGITKMFDGLSGLASLAWDYIVKPIIDAIVSFFRDTDWASVASSIWNGITNAVNAIDTSLGFSGFVTNVYQAIKNELVGGEGETTVYEEFAQSVYDGVKDIFESIGLQDAITDAWSGTVDLAQAIYDAIFGRGSGSYTELAPPGESMAGPTFDNDSFIESLFGSVEEAVSSMSVALDTWFREVFGTITIGDIVGTVIAETVAFPTTMVFSAAELLGITDESTQAAYDDFRTEIQTFADNLGAIIDEVLTGGSGSTSGTTGTTGVVGQATSNVNDTLEDLRSVINTLSSIIDVILEVAIRVQSATLIVLNEYLQSLSEALHDLQDVDFDGIEVGLLGIGAGLASLNSAAIFAKGVSLLAFAGHTIALGAALNGIIQATPEFLQALADLGEGDIGGASKHGGGAIKEFTEGVGEFGIALGNAGRELLGLDTVTKSSLLDDLQTFADALVQIFIYMGDWLEIAAMRFEVGIARFIRGLLNLPTDVLNQMGIDLGDMGDLLVSEEKLREMEDDLAAMEINAKVPLNIQFDGRFEQIDPSNIDKLVDGLNILWRDAIAEADLSEEAEQQLMGRTLDAFGRAMSDPDITPEQQAALQGSMQLLIDSMLSGDLALNESNLQKLRNIMGDDFVNALVDTINTAANRQAFQDEVVGLINSIVWEGGTEENWGMDAMFWEMLGLSLAGEDFSAEIPPEVAAQLDAMGITMLQAVATYIANLDAGTLSTLETQGIDPVEFFAQAFGLDSTALGEAVGEAILGSDIQISEEARAVLMTQLAEAFGITPEALQSAINMATGGTPIEIDVPIEPNITLDTDGAIDTGEDTLSAQLAKSLAGDTGFAGLLDPLTQEVESAAGDVAETTQEMVEDADAVTTAMENMQLYTIEDIQLIVGELQNLQAEFTNTATAAESQMACVVAAVKSVEIAVMQMRAVSAAHLAGFRTDIAVTQGVVVAAMITMKTWVDQLRSSLEAIVGTYTAEIQVTQGSGAVPEERATGGPVFAGNLYEVAERGLSELLRVGDRTFLIPGQDGHVIPLQDFIGNYSLPEQDRNAFFGGVPEPTTTNNYSSGSNYVYEDNSTWEVNINGSGLGAEELQQAVRDGILEVQDSNNRNFRSKMQSRGSF